MIEQTRERLGGFGVWISPVALLNAPIDQQREGFARIEALGYRSVWFGEPPAVAPVVGREVIAQLAVALASTERLVAASGIANISRRDAGTTHSAAATLAEAYPGRLVLGLGGKIGDRPLTGLRTYLDQMDAAAELSSVGVPYPRVLAALGPKAHALAAERTHGAHPFLQPVKHTESARQLLGPDRLLIPHQALLLETDADTARGQMRTMLALGQRDAETPYTRHYRRLGYTNADIAGERSDALIDDTFAWGTPKTITRRLHDHLDAGADHVLLHPLTDDFAEVVDQLAEIAPHLRG
ncbi:TIGR03620 family F420-dependent LLM class oxidoreductase [Actinokineospora sp. NBRC 105648]|uniref:TIGR03620 family F420-dependent LLM class oxidoreductase n=1 Tax=Actinokineospora sp. NBRC 105648 TaxID=3032206 RepID=UPI0024A20CBF|nr:TIGR03620 family F420-dependent LLM class oxidoreductase [Actinokineospora sp. NBRC 105648]GLZ39151.1 LLM class F420-dependent oxidoreductase [Actinokineospora sp. NBRC 105648]